MNSNDVFKGACELGNPCGVCPHCRRMRITPARFPRPTPEQVRQSNPPPAAPYAIPNFLAPISAGAGAFPRPGRVRPDVRPVTKQAPTPDNIRIAILRASADLEIQATLPEMLAYSARLLSFFIDVDAKAIAGAKGVFDDRDS